jgi:hypothetical protein
MVSPVGVLESAKRKNRHRWRFFQNVGFSRFCFYVNLPLFLRLGAGVAKVKVKVETGKGHGVLLLAGKNAGQ